MDQEILYKELIPQPERWRLALEIGAEQVEVAVFPLQKGLPLLHRTIKLNPELPIDKAVQEVVYANPLLLSDFARIDVLLDSQGFCMVPPVTTQSVQPADMLTMAGIDLTGKSSLVCEASPKNSVVFAVDSSLEGFIRRTFFNVRISHILAPIIANPLMDNSLLAAVSPSQVLLFAISDGLPLYANTLRNTSPEDATYYIYAVSNNLPVKHLTIVLAGKPADTQIIEQYLGKYVASPGLFQIPSKLLPYGADVKTLTIPLIALLSCE